MALPFFGRRPADPPRLSVCVITLDRGAELRGLLENVVPWAWEVVVLDGGSRDGTADLCRDAGDAVRFESHPWDGDFAAQKNRCFDLARGDWILDLDTDERVGPWLEARLPELCASTRHDFYRLPMYWLTSVEPATYVESRQHYPCHIPRLFRNVPEHRYTDEKPIHPKFHDDVVARMKKVHKAHLFHYCFVWTPRSAIEEKLSRYRDTYPESDETNRKYYTWWEIPHRLRPCREPLPRGSDAPAPLPGGGAPEGDAKGAR